MSENNCNMVESTDGTCPAVGYQRASVCVPVSVKPFATTGATKTRCCGVPVVVPGRKICEGEKNGQCYFTISQNICVEVPVEFGAEAEVGDTYVECIDASSEETLCEDCSERAATKSSKTCK